MRISKKKRILAIILAVAMVLMFMPSGAFGGIEKVFAKTYVHLEDGDSYDLTNAGKNTIVVIDDDTVGADNTGTVELMGSSTYVWVHISVSEGKTVNVRLADGLNIKPGFNSAYGSGSITDSLGKSRSGIYIDETKKSGGTVILTSEPNAHIYVDSYQEFLFASLPAIMKNNSKTKLIFDTEDKNNPGTIVAKNTSGPGACGIGAFGHGFLGIATSKYTVGNIEFRGGNIEAYGGVNETGIGATVYSSVKDLTFNGAHVIAKAGNELNTQIFSSAPGIGANYYGKVETIKITDGYVEAWGVGSGNDTKGRPLKQAVDHGGCGIGVGLFCSLGTIEISGGTVVAHGGTGTTDTGNGTGCAIGTILRYGDNEGFATGDKILITGGNITAVGGDYACGIGGCVKDITIAPATPDTELKINASIDDTMNRAGAIHSIGAGIGIGNNVRLGYADYPGNITIKGGDITAKAGQIGTNTIYAGGKNYRGAAIGSTFYGRVTSLTITGGKINAIGGYNGPGIGGTFQKDDNRGVVDNIHISGGTITATKPSTNASGEPINGIGGLKNEEGESTDIRITGGSVISDGSDYSVGYSEAGQPKNDAGEIVYGTKFKFDPDCGEWTPITEFSPDPELSYHYGLDDVYTKKGLWNEADDNIVEFWLPKSGASGYKCIAKTSDKAYISDDPEKVEAGDTATLKAFTDITYVNGVTGETYKGTGIYGHDKLSIDPAPAVMSRYKLSGYSDSSGKMIANGGYNETELLLVMNTAYADTSGKWKANVNELTLNMMLQQTEYLVIYHANKPETASHNITGTMHDDTFSVQGTNKLSKNQYDIAGWTFKGWNTEPDGSGDSYSDQEELTFNNWDTLKLYAQWEPKSYTVTFDPDEAAGQSTYTQEFKYDQAQALKPNTFTYEDHDFMGWETLAMGSFYKDQAVVKNMCTLDANGTPKGHTLYAEWIEADVLAIVINDNGQAITSADPSCIDLKTDTGTISPQFAVVGNGYYAYNLPDGTYTAEFTGDLAVYKPQSEVVIEAGKSSLYNWDYYTLSVSGDDHSTSYFVDGTMLPTVLEHVPEHGTVNVKTKTDEGYKFVKYTAVGVEPTWQNGDKTIAEQTLNVNGEAALNAVSAPIEYKVNFDKNKPANASHDVKGTMEDMDFIYEEEHDLTENAYTLDHWTFTGWNTAADGSGTPYDDKATVKNLTTEDGKTVKLFAQWEPESYNVYFSATSATSGQMNPQEINYDSTVNLNQNEFERTDWHFLDWNTEPAGGGDSYEDGASVTNLTEKKSITLYAQWEHDYYTVTFDKNDEKAEGEMPDDQIWTNCAFELPLCSYYKPGYSFDSWNTAPDGSGKSFADGEALENEVAIGETLKLYAQWKPNKYTVTYDANSGSGTMDDQTFTYDQSGTLNPNKFVNPHYTFSGWNTRADGSGDMYQDTAKVKNLTIYPGDTVTLYAQWTKEKHTIKFDLNGGTLDGQTGIIEKTYNYGDKIVLAEPTRDGYTFDYWEGSHYNAGDTYTVTEDHTLTAQWVEKKKADPDNPDNPKPKPDNKKESGGSGKSAKTGDAVDMLVLSILLLASAMGIAVVALFRRKVHN